MNLTEVAAGGTAPLATLLISLGIALAIAVAIFFLTPRLSRGKTSRKDQAIFAGLAGALALAVVVPVAGGIAEGQADADKDARIQETIAAVKETYEIDLQPVQAEQLRSATPIPIGKNAEGEDIAIYGSTQTWDEDNQWLQGIFLYKEGATYHLGYQGGASNIVELPLPVPAEEPPAEEPVEETPTEEPPADEEPTEEPVEEAPTEETTPAEAEETTAP